MPEASTTRQNRSGDNLAHAQNNKKILMFKETQSRYCELFWSCRKLPLISKKPENDSLIR